MSNAERPILNVEVGKLVFGKNQPFLALNFPGKQIYFF
jgi:hypothetical protein